MANDRKAAEAVALAWVKDVDTTGRSYEYLKERFSKMTNAQFEKWIEAMEEGIDYLSVISENMGAEGSGLTIENNLKVAEKRGVPMFERIWVVHPRTKLRYLTNLPYPIQLLPIKRQIETIENKRAIPSATSKKRDEMTGQLMSAEMSLSLPETQILYAMGLESVIVESMKYRGGDIEGGDEFDRRLLETGEVSINNLLETDTEVRSTSTLHVMWEGMHLDQDI